MSKKKKKKDIRVWMNGLDEIRELHENEFND